MRVERGQTKLRDVRRVGRVKKKKKKKYGSCKQKFGTAALKKRKKLESTTRPKEIESCESGETKRSPVERFRIMLEV